MQSRNQRRYGAIERLERALNNPSFDEAYKVELRTRIAEIERNIANDPNGRTHGGKSVTAFKPVKPIGKLDVVTCDHCGKSPPRWMYLERGIIDNHDGSIYWFCPDCKEHAATRLAS